MDRLALNRQALHAHTSIVAEHHVVRAAAQAGEVEHRVALKRHVLLRPNHASSAVKHLNRHARVEAGHCQRHLARRGVREHAKCQARFFNAIDYADTVAIFVDGVIDG